MNSSSSTPAIRRARPDAWATGVKIWTVRKGFKDGARAAAFTFETASLVKRFQQERVAQNCGRHAAARTTAPRRSRSENAALKCNKRCRSQGCSQSPLPRAVDARPADCGFHLVPAPGATIAMYVHGDDSGNASETHASTHRAAAADLRECAARIAAQRRRSQRRIWQPKPCCESS